MVTEYNAKTRPLLCAHNYKDVFWLNLIINLYLQIIYNQRIKEGSIENRYRLLFSRIQSIPSLLRELFEYLVTESPYLDAI